MSEEIFWRPIKAVQEFVDLHTRFRHIEGFLLEVEAFALYKLAQLGSASGAIVEIGSYLGRSTAFLAAGSKLVGREKVVAIDHFRGSLEHQPGGKFASSVLTTHGSTFERFKENLRQADLLDYVTPIVAGSEQAAAGWTGPIRLLFIDADHSYEASKRDFELWSPFLASDAILLFHDVGVWEGVTRFYEELMRTSTEFHQVGEVMTLRIVQRRPTGV